ncbi:MULTISPECIES: TetR/AcrR family transcriptional regulator [Microbacterium]|nr:MULTISPECIES: TetR/AcrR family transcriptional regulator [Microbacterium]
MSAKRNGARTTALRALNARSVMSPDLNAAPEIIEAAVRVFDEFGYEGTSFRRIAEVAGTSKSLVTYFFPTKQALVGTIVDLAFPGGVFMGTKRTDDDPLDAIVAVAEQVTDSLLHDPLARVSLMLMDRRTDGSPPASPKFSGWLARLTDYLEEAQRKELIAPDADPPREAKYLLSGIIGLAELARDSGAYLRLVEDAVLLTRDRLAHIVVGPRARELRA